MTNSQRLATVRERLKRWIADADTTVSSVTIVRESLLIRQQHYVGHRFQTESHHAVWFIEEDQLKIFNADNELQSVLNSAEIDQIEAADDETAPVVIKLPEQSESQDEGDGEIRRAA